MLRHRFLRHRASLVLVVLILLGGAGCTGDSEPSGKKEVLVATLMSHPALDQVRKSMRTELKDRGWVPGEDVEITVKNANGETRLVSSIVQDAKSRNPNVIVAITTPMAQAFAKNTSAPLVFSAVTDPVGAGIVADMDQITEGVSGVSDAWPYQAQLELIGNITPEAKRVGLVYNPGEAASQYGKEKIEKYAEAQGFELVHMVATQTSEVLSSVRQGIDKVDAIYLSSDNTVIQALPAALKVCLETQTPLYVGDSGTVEKGGLAAASVGYEGVGRETGRIVAQFLEGQTRVKPVVAKGEDIYINLETAKKLGVKVPKQILDRAEKVYRDIPEKKGEEAEEGDR